MTALSGAWKQLFGYAETRDIEKVTGCQDDGFAERCKKGVLKKSIPRMDFIPRLIWTSRGEE